MRVLSRPSTFALLGRWGREGAVWTIALPLHIWLQDVWGGVAIADQQLGEGVFARTTRTPLHCGFYKHENQADWICIAGHTHANLCSD